jgi:hypothetical protein
MSISDQSAMFARKNLDLRILDLIGCTIPLTSPILSSPHLTCLFMNIPREARQVHAMLQAAPQLRTIGLKLVAGLESPEATHFLPKIDSRHLEDLFLGGVNVAVLTVLEHFKFTRIGVRMTLFVGVLPTPGNSRRVGRRLFEVPGKAILPSDDVNGASDPNRVFSPHAFGINFTEGQGYNFYTQCWGTSSNPTPPMNAAVWCYMTR